MTSCFSPSRPGVGAGKCSTYCVESNSSASVILPLPMTSAYRRRTSALLSSVDIEKPPSLELIASRPQQQPYTLNIVFHPMGAVAHGSVPRSPPSPQATARCVKSCEHFFQEEESHRCSSCPIQVYTRIGQKILDARLLQEGKQRLQLLQLVLPECICDCCLGLLP